MRAFDQWLRWLMWLGVVAGLALFAFIVINGGKGGNIRNPQQWLTIVGILGLLWVPSAFGVWSWDGTRTGAQSAKFYISAALAIGLAALIVTFFFALMSSFG